MNKRKKSGGKRTEGKNKFRFSKGLFIAIGIGITIITLSTYFGIQSLIPVNGTFPVFAAPRNAFIKATHSSQTGYYYISQSTGGVKGSRGGSNSLNPVYVMKKDSLESVHLINEDYETHSKHNINIDKFNVHSHDLDYFQSQSITFIASKTGNFSYYCTIHPEMRGEVIVEP